LDATLVAAIRTLKAQTMIRTTYIANITFTAVESLTAALTKARSPKPIAIGRVNVAELGALRPSLLICDIDSVAFDPLETLRQLRFVLPDCIIIVYTSETKRAWGIACHSAGANGILATTSSVDDLAAGIRSTMRSGCFTDPHLTAA
jgi:CheY-like chemotaxis protein